MVWTATSIALLAALSTVLVALKWTEFKRLFEVEPASARTMPLTATRKINAKIRTAPTSSRAASSKRFSRSLVRFVFLVVMARAPASYAVNPFEMTWGRPLELALRV
jgi:hypothetical protein